MRLAGALAELLGSELAGLAAGEGADNLPSRRRCWGGTLLEELPRSSPRLGATDLARFGQAEGDHAGPSVTAQWRGAARRASQGAVRFVWVAARVEGEFKEKSLSRTQVLWSDGTPGAKPNPPAPRTNPDTQWRFLGIAEHLPRNNSSPTAASATFIRLRRHPPQLPPWTPTRGVARLWTSVTG